MGHVAVYLGHVTACMSHVTTYMGHVTLHMHVGHIVMLWLQYKNIFAFIIQTCFCFNDAMMNLLTQYCS